MAPPLSSPSESNKTISISDAESKNGRSFKPLATRFQYDGFDFRQIARERDVAIFEPTRSGHPNICNYEVVRIRKRKGSCIGGRTIEATEVYLRSET